MCNTQRFADPFLRHVGANARKLRALSIDYDEWQEPLSAIALQTALPAALRIDFQSMLWMTNRGSTFFRDLRSLRELVLSGITCDPAPSVAFWASLAEATCLERLHVIW